MVLTTLRFAAPCRPIHVTDFLIANTASTYAFIRTAGRTRLGNVPQENLKGGPQGAEEDVEGGIDPREKRQAAKNIKRPTFREVAKDWFVTRTKPSGKDSARKSPL